MPILPPQLEQLSASYEHLVYGLSIRLQASAMLRLMARVRPIIYKYEGGAKAWGDQYAGTNVLEAMRAIRKAAKRGGPIELDKDLDRSINQIFAWHNEVASASSVAMTAIQHAVWTVASCYRWSESIGKEHGKAAIRAAYFSYFSTVYFHCCAQTEKQFGNSATWDTLDSSSPLVKTAMSLFLQVIEHSVAAIDRELELVTYFAERPGVDSTRLDILCGALWPDGPPMSWPTLPMAADVSPRLRIEFWTPSGSGAAADERICDAIVGLSDMHSAFGGSGLKISDIKTYEPALQHVPAGDPQ